MVTPTVDLLHHILEMTISVTVVITMIDMLLEPTTPVTHSGMVLVVLVAPAVPSTLLRGSVRTCLHQLLITSSCVSVWMRTLKMYSLK